jgi:hypothetical protein
MHRVASNGGHTMARTLLICASLIGYLIGPISATAETCSAYATPTGWHKVADTEWNFGFDVDTAAGVCLRSDCQGFLHVTVQYLGDTGGEVADRYLVGYHILQGQSNTYVAEYQFYPQALAGDASILNVIVEAVSCTTQDLETPRFKPPRLGP